ncbi:hypothetical protein SAMN05216404_111106 [Nitrosospira multiformis]|uniref:Uncharacterized protein n=1 Tax=Nitrosospira multiformis TaxID=1231 RepID=A0A1H8LZY8_9PROT|nr:hypothetical protein [Nitrosospira multiformis]SEO10702.1 hypothetical protein SAMN05216404_111106 [Nitrosospira multiformis]
MMENSVAKGLLSIEVKAPPIVAGTQATVSLVIRNPFSQEVVIESIQAPSSAPLLPMPAEAEEKPSPMDGKNSSYLARFASIFSGIRVKEISFGSLTAEFPGSEGKKININMEPHSKAIVKSPLGPYDIINFNVEEGAELVFDIPDAKADSKSTPSKERIIFSQQEDLASFELKTAHWLLVKPKVLDLYALIKFRVGNEPHSQVVPVTLSIQPPVKSIVFGAVSGGILGWLARQLNKGVLTDDFSVAASVVSVLGVIVMAMILAIVLSRQESSKGFVTLEDFYGAFVVGAIFGYTGTQYFEASIKAAVRPTDT